MERSKRFEFFDTLDVAKDTYLKENPALGVIAMNSPLDPKPSLKIIEGVIMEMDGKKRDDFDMIDTFIANYSIDQTIAEEAMMMDSREFARKLVDINVPRSEIVKYTVGMTPAKICEIVGHLTAVEMMMAASKMRCRKTPANQTHVCNAKDDPALLAADAATAALGGFAEIETTVAVFKDAPAIALGILIGSQVGRPGVLTQCAVEEATELDLGMRGLTSYAETISNYGTEAVFVDGDDSPYSKILLAAAYASRGIKMRFTSGTGAELLMGESEGKSTLYLEARCIAMTRGSGVQGVQNGGISCSPINASLPGGQLAILAENLIVMLYDMEVASGNDAPWSGSTARKFSHLLPWLITGTDFINSGFGYTTVKDNMFSGACFNVEDIEDITALQRDFRVEGGVRPLFENEVIQVRRKAARAVQAICEELDLPGYTEKQIEETVYALSSEDISRDPMDNMKLAELILERNITGVDLVKALAKRGFNDVADNLLSLLKQRVIGDYLQTSAILDNHFNVLSAVNDKNDYAGPGTGFKLDQDRWEKIQHIRYESSFEDFMTAKPDEAYASIQLDFNNPKPAERGRIVDEVVVALSPAFNTKLFTTMNGIPCSLVLKEVLAGIEEEGIESRVIRVIDTADVGFIGHKAAKLSGSGIAVGVQAKGTAVIHQKDLPPLGNLELFSMAPFLTLDHYRTIGKNAAKYAKGEQPVPVSAPWGSDAHTVKARTIPKAAAMQAIESNEKQTGVKPIQVEVNFI